jgi:hypothetical protein
MSSDVSVGLGRSFSFWGDIFEKLSPCILITINLEIVTYMGLIGPTVNRRAQFTRQN